MLLSALMAFAPILTVDFLLDEYIRMRESKALRHEVSAIINETQGSVDSALRSLNEIVSRSPSLCTPTFFE